MNGKFKTLKRKIEAIRILNLKTENMISESLKKSLVELNSTVEMTKKRVNLKIDN